MWCTVIKLWLWMVVRYIPEREVILLLTVFNLYQLNRIPVSH